MEVQSSILCRNNFFAKIKQSLSVLLLFFIFLGLRRAIREAAENCMLDMEVGLSLIGSG